MNRERTTHRHGQAALLAAAAMLMHAGAVQAAPQQAESVAAGLAGAMALGVAQGQATEPAEIPSVAPRFGDIGSEWWSISASGMADNDDNDDFSLRFSYHRFLAEDFEINLGLTGWFHDQPNNDELSGSFDLGFRYHFLAADDKRWTTYADIGIGFMLSSGDVPEGGTDYNFTPRVALGTTLRLPDSLGGSVGARLDLSAGWQHYSNASTSGSDKNPARDSLFVRVGVIFPF